MTNAMPKQWYGPAARAQRKWQARQYRYLARARGEAEKLGHEHVGFEHVLLALVAPDETSVAAQALRESGVDYESLREALQATQQSRPARPRRWQTPSPAFYTLQGIAQGMAAALGAKQVDAEHLLRAILWDGHARSATLLKQLGTSPRAVQRRLATLGASVPPRQPPLADDTRWGEWVTERVPSSDAWELASGIQELLPENAPIGFNFNTTTAWFKSGEGVDLAPIVRKARRQQLAHRRRHPRTELEPPTRRARP